MRAPPSNRNVPQYMWDDAEREYAAYKRRYDALIKHGLSDAEADRYIDLTEMLATHIAAVHDAENEDFFVDDLRHDFDQAEQALAEMRQLWEKLK
jgi:hypothetical protein